jgi:hypothetical protein
MEKTGKNGPINDCTICNFKCSKTFNWNRHLLTEKHKKNEIINKQQQLATLNNEKTGNTTIEAKFSCKNCYKAYNERSGLWRHSKKCKPTEIVSENTFTSAQEATKIKLTEETVLELLEQNNEFKTMLVKIINKEIINKEIINLL